MSVSEMRRLAGMSQREFAEHFGIPVRTLQQWEQGVSSPPPYVLSMMEKLSPPPRRRVASDAASGADRFAIPEKRRWKVCIDRPFPNCERIYPLQQRKVRELLDDMTGDPAVRRVVVFGSSTTQRCHRGSDVDLYVELTADRDPVRQAHDFPFDLWTNFTADDRLKREISEKGVVVYG